MKSQDESQTELEIKNYPGLLQDEERKKTYFKLLPSMFHELALLKSKGGPINHPTP